MILKVLILSTALTAHFWLWGQWSLEKSQSFGLGLVAATVMLLFLVVYPVRSYLNKQGLLQVFSKTWVQVIIYAYVLSILILSVMTFSGLMRYLLPIKIILILAFAWAKLKWKSFSKK